MTSETDESMHLSSASEAPTWSQEAAAPRRRAGPGLRGSSRLELVSADATHLRFAGRRAVLAPLLLSPLFVTLAGLPWLGPDGMNPVRALTSAGCALAAGALASWSWPRQRRVHILGRGPLPDGASSAAQGKVRWVLDVERAPNSEQVTYSVRLECDGAEPRTVLEGSDPERLLWQLSEVLRHWPGPVECRWGLPDAARPWSIEPHSGPRNVADGADRRSLRVPLAHRPLLWMTRAMAAFVAVDLVFLVTSAAGALPRLHPLSLALPVALGSCLVTLACALGSGSTRLRVGGDVCKESGLLGWVRHERSVRLESVRGVYALGLPAAERWHVLIDSSDGPLALSVPRRDARALAQDVERAIHRARSAS